MNSSIVFHYFNDLTPTQTEQIDNLGRLYKHWNSQINVISRKDIDALYLHHVLHSLAIAKFIKLAPSDKVLDVGTGGGFPGIPLAILFPDTQFTLVDSIGKKIKVVQEVSQALGLKNINAMHSRVENISGNFHFVISRAVARLSTFYPWVENKIEPVSRHETPNGILYLKGGELEEEIKESRLKAELIPIERYFSEPFFNMKFIVYVPK